MVFANNLSNLGCIYFSNQFFYMIHYSDRGRHLDNKTRLFCSCFVQIGTKCAHIECHTSSLKHL